MTTSDSQNSTVRDVPSPAGPSVAITLVGICALGLIVRLLHWSALVQTSWPQHPLTYTEADTFAFYAWAQTILAGDWMGWNTFHPYFEWMRSMAPLETWYHWWGGKEIFHQAPLYPYLLAVFLGLCGDSLSGVLLLQLIIGAFQPVIIYALVKRTFCPAAGLVAAGLTALYGPFVFYQAVVLRDWLSPILEPLGLLFALRASQENRARDWLLAGGFLGLALLARETALVILLVVVVWILDVSGRHFRHALTRTGLLAVGLLLCLLPLFGRNLVVGAPLFSLSTRNAEAVIMANATGPRQESLPTLLDRSQGDPFSVFFSSVEIGRATWRQHLQLLKLKVQLIADVFEYPNNVSLYYGMEISPILRWLPGYGLLFPLGVAGAFLVSHRGKDRYLCLLYGIGTLSWLFVISAVSRYRLALVPFLIIYSAALVSYLVEKFRATEWRAIAVRVAVLLVPAVILQRAVLTLPDSAKDYAYRPDYVAAARTYAELKQYDRAAAEMRTLIAKNDAMHGHRPIPNYLLADYRLFQAHGFLQRGLRAEAREALAQAVATFTEPVKESEAALSYPLFNFGLLYLKLDEPAQARQVLQRFLELDPTNPLADKARSLLSRLDGADPALSHTQ